MERSRFCHFGSIGLAAILLTGCQSKEDIATEACIKSIVENIRAPTTFNLVERRFSQSPALTIENSDKSRKYEYLNIDIIYDAEDSFGTPIRNKHECKFILEDNKMDSFSNLELYYATNKALNAKVCYEKTISSKSENRALSCYAPFDLKKECCLPRDHYIKMAESNLWK